MIDENEIWYVARIHFFTEYLSLSMVMLSLITVNPKGAKWIIILAIKAHIAPLYFTQLQHITKKEQVMKYKKSLALSDC